MSGYQNLKNETKVYVFLTPDQLPDSIFALEGEALIEKNSTVGRNACLVLKYPGDVKNISLRYGISFIDEAQARDNLIREVGSRGLGDIHSEGRQIWNEALSKIRVKGGTSDNRSVFYTALYRTFNRPVSISENGRYYSASDGKVYPDQGRPFYVDDESWNTFRALHPLMAVIEPDKELNILNSYLRVADHMDNYKMPENIYVTGNHPAIHSNHIIVSFLDAYNKGLRNFDLESAFTAGKSAVMQRTLAPVADGPADDLNRFYQNHGFVPAIRHTEKETVSSVNQERKRMAVSVTLGTAYDDWALSQLAEKMGNKKEQLYFYKRSLNYRNLFNSRTGFFHPKDVRGEFLIPFDYELSGGPNGYLYYTEGNAWNYRFGLRHNIDELIELNGGKEIFASRLDHLFTKSLGLSRFRHYLQFPTQTGMVGGFAMGNEHSFHIPYLYNYAGQPWKTQERIHSLLKQWFRNDLMGMPGEDDGGAMSAFAVFSLMGIYPVTPGIPIYNIGSPHFDNVNIEVSTGEDFEIVAKNLSPRNKYIQAATLNGAPLTRPWFVHDDILQGGKLVLKMGPKPNTNWGIAPAAVPPSKPFAH